MVVLLPTSSSIKTWSNEYVFFAVSHFCSQKCCETHWETHSQKLWESNHRPSTAGVTHRSFENRTISHPQPGSLTEALRIEPSAIHSRGLQIEISRHAAFVIKVRAESTNRNQSCPCRKGQRYGLSIWILESEEKEPMKESRLSSLTKEGAAGQKVKIWVGRQGQVRNQRNQRSEIGGYGYRYRHVLMSCPASTPPLWVCICWLCVWCMCLDVVPCIWKKDAPLGTCRAHAPLSYVIVLCTVSLHIFLWCYVCGVMPCTITPPGVFMSCPCPPIICHGIVHCVPCEGVWRSLQIKTPCGVQEEVFERNDISHLWKECCLVPHPWAQLQRQGAPLPFTPTGVP